MLQGKPQVEPWGEARDTARGNLHGATVPRIADRARFVLGSEEGAEAHQGHAVAAHETGLHAVQEGIQRLGRLRVGKARIAGHGSDQFTLVHGTPYSGRERYIKGGHVVSMRRMAIWIEA